MGNNELLEINDLKKYFPVKKGLFKRVDSYIKAVNGVSLSINEKETLGLVGESGCGKTTLGRTILRLYEPTGGEIYFNKERDRVPILDLNKEEMRKIRASMQMIFQDPFSSLNERMTVMGNIIEPLVVNKIGTKNERKKRAEELLVEVGLKEEHLRRYPHSFSGGQRQRVGIARALSINPSFIVADEPVFALDVSVQAQILNLLKDLQDEFDLTFLFISHDLGVIRYVSDRIAVMYVGNLVEIGPREELLVNPKHPYTEALLSSVPKPTPAKRSGRIILEGNPPDPSNLPEGCIFNNRCNYSTEKCKKENPEWEKVNQNKEHYVTCHLYNKINLRGISLEK